RRAPTCPRPPAGCGRLPCGQPARSRADSRSRRGHVRVGCRAMKVDLHSHSTVSDGTDSPTELVSRMAEAGITTLALTDHDTLAGLPEAREEAKRRGMELISGAEISAEWGGQDDIHIVALFVDERNARFNAALAERQEERRTRGERMAKKLVEAGYAIDL